LGEEGVVGIQVVIQFKGVSGEFGHVKVHFEAFNVYQMRQMRYGEQGTVKGYRQETMLTLEEILIQQV